MKTLVGLVVMLVLAIEGRLIAQEPGDGDGFDVVVGNGAGSGNSGNPSDEGDEDDSGGSSDGKDDDTDTDSGSGGAPGTGGGGNTGKAGGWEVIGQIGGPKIPLQVKYCDLVVEFIEHDTGKPAVMRQVKLYDNFRNRHTQIGRGNNISRFAHTAIQQRMLHLLANDPDHNPVDMKIATQKRSYKHVLVKVRPSRQAKKKAKMAAQAAKKAAQEAEKAKKKAAKQKKSPAKEEKKNNNIQL